MACTYEGDKNNLASRKVEQLADDGAWKSLEINNDSPGFLIFVYSLLTCQHLYMFTNAAEHGLLLQSAEGTLLLEISEAWMLANLLVDFTVKLRAGTPTPEIVEDIRHRMNQCPVSRNINSSGPHETRLHFVA
jgi:hypothetical protein